MDILKNIKNFHFFSFLGYNLCDKEFTGSRSYSAPYYRFTHPGIRGSVYLEISYIQAFGQSGQTGHSGRSGLSEHSRQSGQSRLSGHSGHSGQSGQSGQSGHAGQSGHSGHSGWTEPITRNLPVKVKKCKFFRPNELINHFGK